MRHFRDERAGDIEAAVSASSTSAAPDTGACAQTSPVLMSFAKLVRLDK